MFYSSRRLTIDKFCIGLIYVSIAVKNNLRNGAYDRSSGYFGLDINKTPNFNAPFFGKFVFVPSRSCQSRLQRIEKGIKSTATDLGKNIYLDKNFTTVDNCMAYVSNIDSARQNPLSLTLCKYECAPFFSNPTSVLTWSIIQAFTVPFFPVHVMK